MIKNLKRQETILIIRLIISLVLWISGIILFFCLKIEEKPIFELNEIIIFSLIIISYLIIGFDVIINAFKKLFSGEFLGEDFLMMIASVSAILLILLGEREYIEAAAIMIFYQIGELFQSIAVRNSQKSISECIKLKVNLCHIEDKDVEPQDVKIGTIIKILPGEIVPIDGLAQNNVVINQASLTGESLDKYVEINDLVLSGSLNQNTVLYLKTTKEYKDSTVSKILDLVKNSAIRKTKVEKIISKFAKVYTPIVVAIALLFGLILPLIIGFINGFTPQLFNKYLYIAITCLIVSCPCALVVSVPLTYFSAIGLAAKKKIIIKGSTYLDILIKAKQIVMDKTGTITKSTFKVTKISDLETYQIAKSLEINSTHPLSKPIINYNVNIDTIVLTTTEIPGLGIKGVENNNEYLIGSYKLMKENNIEVPNIVDPGHILFVSKNNHYLGYLILEDEIKDEAKKVINELQAMNKEITILSGDDEKIVKKVSNELNINHYYASLLPLDKVEKMNDINKRAQDNKEYTIFIGDGINDAPVLTEATLGISMGQLGSDAAIEASDIVILNDNLEALPVLFKIAKKTRKIIVENIFISLFIKFIVLILSIISTFYPIFTVPLFLAIFADVGTLIIAILNSLRAFKIKNH